MKPDLDVTALHMVSQQESSCAFNDVENPQLATLLEEYLTVLQSGNRPDRAAFLAQYPDLADTLAPLLDGLEFVHQVAPQLRSETANSSGEHPSQNAGPPTLGDYRILREVGRGGMGVVYQAEQISLGRSVALKVLPFAAVMDPRQLARFKNEAQAAATLDHPNIVPVHAIGCDRGVHYFAMRFIAGQSLAEVISDLRRRDGITIKGHRDSATAEELLSMPSKSQQSAAPTGPSSTPTVRAQAAISTQHSTDPATFIHSVARLGVQAAEALDHAHQHGVLHRDIKPGNLMLDATGKLWVTDFGLARIGNDAGMTMSGDLLGTMRYMSPEQALAKRVIVDHRTDIYSLGVTLYELATLHPVFSGDDRQELLRKIAFDEPEPPRVLNKAIPADLETIVLKAIAKDPRERYSTAQELADDLLRLLTDQSIRARRPNVLMRIRKWSRRHRVMVNTAVGVAACALVLGAALLWRERSQTLAALNEARQERETAQHERKVSRLNFQRAQQAVDDYFTAVSESTLLDSPGMAPLRKQLLEAALEYYEQFVESGYTDPSIQSEVAAAQLRMGLISMQTASPDWLVGLRNGVQIVDHLVASGADTSAWTSLRAGTFNYRGRDDFSLARSKESIEICDNAILIWLRLVNANPGVFGFQNDLASFHLLRAVIQQRTGQNRDAIRTLHRARDIWESLAREDAKYNWQLGLAYQWLSRAHFYLGQSKEAKLNSSRYISLLDELATLYPGVPSYIDRLGGAWYERGIGLYRLHEWEAAAEALATSRTVHPSGYWMADLHSARGASLAALDRYEEATIEFDRAIEIDKNGSDSFYRRGWVASTQGRYDDALEDFEEAARCDESDFIALRRLAWFLTTCPRPQFWDPKRAVILAENAALSHPREGVFWYTLGVCQYRNGRFDEARKACQRGIELRESPDSIRPEGEPRVVTDYDRYAGFFLAMSHWQLGSQEKAREAYDAAVVWMNEHAPNDGQLQRFCDEAQDLIGHTDEGRIKAVDRHTKR